MLSIWTSLKICRLVELNTDHYDLTGYSDFRAKHAFNEL